MITAIVEMKLDEYRRREDELDALRGRVAKLEAALKSIKIYAEAHDEEWVLFTVDEALKDEPR